MLKGLLTEDGLESLQLPVTLKHRRPPIAVPIRALVYHQTVPTSESAPIAAPDQPGV
jgi:hypothetical protein